MKVSQLIKILNKLPKNLDVYTADHDHGTFEVNALVRQCELIDKNDMNDRDNDDGDFEGDNTFKDTPIKYVVIRP